MGLSSLPILNKLSASGQWLSLWNPTKTANVFLNTTLMIEQILLILTQERFFFKYEVSNPTCEKVYRSEERLKRLPRSITPHTFLGEVWFLKYSHVIILSPAYISTKYMDEKKFKVRVHDKLAVSLWLQYYEQF